MVSCAACRSFYDWCRSCGAAKLSQCSTGLVEQNPRILIENVGFTWCLLGIARLLFCPPHDRRNGRMGEAPLLQEAHLPRRIGSIGRWLTVFALPDLPGPLLLANAKFFFQLTEAAVVQAVTLKFRQYPGAAETRRPPMDKGFSKPGLGEEFLCLEPVEQGFNVITLLRMPGQLARQLLPAMLARGEITQRTRFQAGLGTRHGVRMRVIVGVTAEVEMKV